MRHCPPWLKGGLIALLFLLGVVAVALLMPLLTAVCRRRAAPLNEAIVLHWNRAVCRVLNLRLRIVGKPDPTAKLCVANHISWLDIIAIGSQLRGQFVAKDAVAAWPLIGYLAQGIGTLFVRRGDASQTTTAAELMLWRLRQGRRLLLFPEGTTTTGDTVLRFHSKLFQPAQLAGVRVQAIALRYEGEAAQIAPFIGEDAFLPHLLRLLHAPELTLCISFCPSLPQGLGRSELAATAQQYIAAVINPAQAEQRPRRRLTAVRP